jgi:hypothetical protein
MVGSLLRRNKDNPGYRPGGGGPRGTAPTAQVADNLSLAQPAGALQFPAP